MQEIEEKYVELLLKRCMNLKKKKILFIDYDIRIQYFVDKIAEYAKKLGVEEIYFNKNDIMEKRNVLSTIKKKDIAKHPMFNSKIWDEYAQKDAAFLMLASEFPGIMDNIDTEYIAIASKAKMESKPLYKKKQRDNELTWLIAVYPNRIWAKNKFPDLDEEKAYEKLFSLMMKVTMCKESNPIECWNAQLKKQAELMKKLNKLKIKTLHYQNKLGTDLTISLNESAVWQSAGSDNNKIIVNMPSYEVFTSPDYRYTNGIVYSSKPLVYNDSVIEDFWLKFENGEVTDFGAKVGKELLKEIIEGDKGSRRLGEVALVDKTSPIAKTNFVFGETCLDENASCHIALGAGFTECIKDYENKSEKDLAKVGLNASVNHVDFMIGTDDLNIEAETKEGKILIFKNGKFNI